MFPDSDYYAVYGLGPYFKELRGIKGSPYFSLLFDVT